MSSTRPGRLFGGVIAAGKRKRGRYRGGRQQRAHQGRTIQPPTPPTNRLSQAFPLNRLSARSAHRKRWRIAIEQSHGEQKLNLSSVHQPNLPNLLGQNLGKIRAAGQRFTILKRFKSRTYRQCEDRMRKRGPTVARKLQSEVPTHGEEFLSPLPTHGFAVQPRKLLKSRGDRLSRGGYGGARISMRAPRRLCLPPIDDAERLYVFSSDLHPGRRLLRLRW